MNRKKGVILSYFLMIFEILNALILTPFVIRTLGQAEFGVYKLAIAINSYLLLLDLGIGNATIKYISKFRANNDYSSERKFFGVVTLYYSTIGIFTFLIGLLIVFCFPYVFARGLSQSEIELGKELFFITMLTSAVTLGTSQFGSTIIAYERFSVSKLPQIVSIIARMILSFFALWLGFGSVGLVLINLITTFILRLFFVYYVIFRIKLLPVFVGINKSFVKEIIFYSTWIFLQMVATEFNSSVDQILIGSLVASSSIIIAIYGIGSQIHQYFKSIGFAFTGVLMPGIVKLVENKANNDVIAFEMIRIGRYIFMILSLIWGIFFVEGKEFVYLWAGKDSMDAYIVAILLMFVEMIVLPKSIGSQILWAKNEHKEQAILKFLVVFLNIILTVFLIKWRPLLGAVIGTFISIFLGDIIVMDYVFYKKLGLNIAKYYFSLFKGIVPSILITILFGFVLNVFIVDYSIVGFIFKSFALIIIYIFCMICFGLNDGEKKIINSILHLK